MVADVALDFLGARTTGGRIKTLGQAPYTLLPGACQGLFFGLFLAKSFDSLNKRVLARITAKVSNTYPRLPVPEFDCAKQNQPLDDWPLHASNRRTYRGANVFQDQDPR